MDKNNAVRNAMLDGIDATFNSGHIRAYTGARPGANQAASGTKIGQGTMPADIFAAAASGSKDLNAAVSITGLAAAGGGTSMGYLRLCQAADDDLASETEPRWEGSIGTEAAGINITAVSQTGGMYRVTANAHGLSNGDIVRIAGHNLSSVNKKWVVYNVTANTFDIAFDPGAGGTASGTARKSYHCTVDNVSLAQNQVCNITSLTLSIS